MIGSKFEHFPNILDIIAICEICKLRARRVKLLVTVRKVNNEHLKTHFLPVYVNNAKSTFSAVLSAIKSVTSFVCEQRQMYLTRRTKRDVVYNLLCPWLAKDVPFMSN